MCLMSSYKRDFLLIKSLQCSWMGFLLLLLKVHYYVFPNLSCHLESLPSLCLLLWSKSAGNLLTEQLRFLGRPVQLHRFFASVSNFSSFLSLFLSSFAWRSSQERQATRLFSCSPMQIWRLELVLCSLAGWYSSPGLLPPHALFSGSPEILRPPLQWHLYKQLADP